VSAPELAHIVPKRPTATGPSRTTRVTTMPDVPASVRHAREAAEHIRAINRALLDEASGLDDPADVHDTVTALTEMFERLPLMTRRLANLVEDFDDAPGLYDDRGLNTDVTVRRAAHWLGSLPLADNAERLRLAAGELSHLGLRDES
jgi:hypothetical protein